MPDNDSKLASYAHLRPTSSKPSNRKNKVTPFTFLNSKKMNWSALITRLEKRFTSFLSFRIRLIPLVIFCGVMVLSSRMTTLYRHVKESKNLTVSQLNANPPEPAATKKNIDSNSSLDLLNLTPDQYKVLTSLAKKNENIALREQALPEKEQVIKTLISRLETKRQELITAKKELEAIIAKIDEHDNANTKKLVKMAEAMKPQEAARVLERIEFPILLEIMESMKEKKASSIITEMEPEKGSYLMTALAKRRKIFKKGDPSKAIMG